MKKTVWAYFIAATAAGLVSQAASCADFPKPRPISAKTLERGKSGGI